MLGGKVGYGTVQTPTGKYTLWEKQLYQLESQGYVRRAKVDEERDPHRKFEPVRWEVTFKGEAWVKNLSEAS